MFEGCTRLNSVLNFSNTGNNLGNVSSMFKSCTQFNTAFTLTTTKVQNMQSMFEGCSAFNKPLIRSGNVWYTRTVTNMTAMFLNCTTFNQNLSGWCVTNLTSLPPLFDTGTPPAWTLANKPVWGTCP
jgi:hypothetical protein